MTNLSVDAPRPLSNVALRVRGENYCQDCQDCQEIQGPQRAKRACGHRPIHTDTRIHVLQLHLYRKVRYALKLGRRDITPKRKVEKDVSVRHVEGDSFHWPMRMLSPCMEEEGEGGIYPGLEKA